MWPYRYLDARRAPQGENVAGERKEGGRERDKKAEKATKAKVEEKVDNIGLVVNVLCVCRQVRMEL